MYTDLHINYYSCQILPRSGMVPQILFKKSPTV